MKTEPDIKDWTAAQEKALKHVAYNGRSITKIEYNVIRPHENSWWIEATVHFDENTKMVIV